jgi:hypothetical protein
VIAVNDATFYLNALVDSLMIFVWMAAAVLMMVFWQLWLKKVQGGL